MDTIWDWPDDNCYKGSAGPKEFHRTQGKQSAKILKMPVTVRTIFTFILLLGLSGFAEARQISPHNMIINAVGNLALSTNETTANMTISPVTEDSTQNVTPTPEINSTETPADEPRRGSELVDEALIPVYDMAKFFLGDMVQTKNLNYMKERGVDFTDLDKIVDSFEDDWQTWAEYLIGMYLIIITRENEQSSEDSLSRKEVFRCIHSERALGSCR